jgi:hypothetical protein
MRKQGFLFKDVGKNETKFAEESFKDALNFKCCLEGCREKHYWEDMIFLVDGRTICKKHKS